MTTSYDSQPTGP